MENSADTGAPGRGLDDALLGALFSQLPVGLHVLDTRLRLVRSNSAAQHVPGFPIADHVGNGLREILHSLGAEGIDAVEATVRQVLATGESARSAEVRVRGPADPRREVVLSAARTAAG